MSGAVGRYAWIGALVLGTVCLPGVGAQIPNSAYPPITLSGMQLILYKTGRINNGWAAYYSTDPQHADTATDSLVIDHLDGHDRQGRSLGPAQLLRCRFRPLGRNARAPVGTELRVHRRREQRGSEDRIGADG